MDRKLDSNSPEKAYRNEGFIDSRDARPLRVLAEYLEPQARFRRLHVHDTIVFFGSARLLPKREAATRLRRCRCVSLW